MFAIVISIFAIISFIHNSQFFDLVYRIIIDLSFKYKIAIVNIRNTIWNIRHYFEKNEKTIENIQILHEYLFVHDTFKAPYLFIQLGIVPTHDH